MEHDLFLTVKVMGIVLIGVWILYICKGGITK
jgi:hypothetical protein